MLYKRPSIRTASCHFCPPRPISRRTSPLLQARPNQDDDEDDEDDPSVDIDALAAALSRRAQELRSTSPKQSTLEAPLPDAVLAEFAAGQTSSRDYELLRLLGRLDIRQSYSSSAQDDQASSTTDGRRAAAVAFLARLETGAPYEGPVTVLLKEYLNGAYGVALNELRVQQALAPFPDRIWRGATQDSASTPPVVACLGWFVASSSDQAAEWFNEQGVMDVGSIESFWLVYRWEQLPPLTMYPFHKQPAPGFKWLGAFSPDTLRVRYIRRLTGLTLRALSYCHQRGVTHGSLSSASIVVSTLEDRLEEKLIVKLDNFGFARVTSGTSGEGVEMAKNLDRRAIVFTLLEIIFRACSNKNTMPIDEGVVGAAALEERLAGGNDLSRRLRNMDELRGGALVLDQEGGWELFEGVLRGLPLEVLVETSTFCNLKR